MTTPNPTFNLLRLGTSSLQISYKLETFSVDGGITSSETRHVHVGRGTTSVQHKQEFGDFLFSFSRVTEQPEIDAENQWFVTGQGNLLLKIKEHDLYEAHTGFERQILIREVVEKN